MGKASVKVSGANRMEVVNGALLGSLDMKVDEGVMVDSASTAIPPSPTNHNADQKHSHLASTFPPSDSTTFTSPTIVTCDRVPHSQGSTNFHCTRTNIEAEDIIWVPPATPQNLEIHVPNYRIQEQTQADAASRILVHVQRPIVERVVEPFESRGSEEPNVRVLYELDGPG